MNAAPSALVQPFTPPSVAPGLATLTDALVTRAALHRGETLSFAFAPEPAPWPFGFSVTLELGGHLWKLEFSEREFLRATPMFADALASIELSALPETMQQALLELTLEPALKKLQADWKQPLLPLAFETGDSSAATRWQALPLTFSANLPGMGNSGRVLFRLWAASEAGACWLAEQALLAWPQAWASDESAAWPIELPLLAGFMRLSQSRTRTLEFSDVLLPPDYPAAQGQLLARWPPDGKSGFRLDVQDGRARVLEWVDNFFKEGEALMVEEAQSEPVESVASALDALLATLTFELGEVRLPLAEVRALAPGKSFPLGQEPLSAVTICLNGQALAKGRLIDLGGNLGVQLTRLLNAEAALPPQPPQNPTTAKAPVDVVEPPFDDDPETRADEEIFS